MKFDDLPDAARVRVPVALAVTGLRRSSYYDKAKRLAAPPVLKLCGGRASGVNVGELRRFLAEPEKYKAPAQAAT